MVRSAHIPYVTIAEWGLCFCTKNARCAGLVGPWVVYQLDTCNVQSAAGSAVQRPWHPQCPTVQKFFVPNVDHRLFATLKRPTPFWQMNGSCDSQPVCPTRFVHACNCAFLWLGLNVVHLPYPVFSQQTERRFYLLGQGTSRMKGQNIMN